MRPPRSSSALAGSAIDSGSPGASFFCAGKGASSSALMSRRQPETSSGAELMLATIATPVPSEFLCAEVISAARCGGGIILAVAPE